MSLEVLPVTRQRELRAFIALPFRLYANEPCWVPPLRVERRLFLSRRVNAFFRHGDAQYFLAYRDGRAVGRISAHVDEAFNAHHGNAWGMFGFLDVEDDPEALEALLGAAERWLRVRGRDRMVGPMDFTMNDECGVLVDGYDHPPVVRTPWHPPYLARLCQGAGLEKAMDLLMWEVRLSDRGETLPVIEDLARRSETDHGIRLRKMSRLRLRRDLDAFAEVYNAAWRGNWGFTPYSEEDLDAYARELQIVFDSDWFMVAEREGEPVAVAITIPDVNQVLARMRGRLLPVGWLRFLLGRRRTDRVRVGFLGVKPSHQHTGIAARLYVEHFELSKRRGGVTGEAGWILETNLAMNRAMEALHARVIRRLRMYERRFSEDAEPAWPEDARAWAPSTPAGTIAG